MLSFTATKERHVNQEDSFVRRSGLAIGAALLIIGLAGCSAAGAPKSTTAAASIKPPAIQNAGELSVCVNLGTPPNEFGDSAGAPVGAEIDLANAVADHLGLKAKFVQLSFAGLIPALQAKQCDTIMSSLYIKPARAKVVDFVPYLTSGSAVAVAKDNPKHITGYNDTLCGVKVLAITGATGADLAKAESAKCVADGHAAIDLTLSDANDAGLQQILAGQVDAYIDTAELLGYYQKKSGGAFKMLGKPFGLIQIGAATNKGTTTLHKALAGALSATEKSGEYAKILTKWGMSKQSILIK
jgi:polar amino acid transport system substrate-binding protein